MSTLKKFGVSLMTLLLCVGIVSTPVFAEPVSTTVDGLEVKLDAEEGSQAGAIDISLSVKNTNDFAINNVTIELDAPDKYIISNGLKKSYHYDTLEANSQSVAINVEYKLETDEGGQKTSADNNDNGEQTDSNDDDNDNDNDASVQNETFNKNIVNTKQADVAETTISGDVTNTENVYTTVTNDNNASKASPKTGSDNSNVFWMVMIAISCSGIMLLLVFRKKICKEALMFLGVLTVGAVVVGISFQTKADETNTVTKVISVSKNVSVGGETVTFSARVFYDGIDENSTTDNTGNLEVDLGEDVVPDLDFTPEEAEPTFASEYDEIANLSELNGGEVPYSLSDDNGTPNYIDGKFSDKSVNSAGEAIKALNDIHYSMGFENAEQEFEEVYSDSVEIPNQEVTNFYRLQQTYHNIPVYGYQLIVSTDTSGNIESLTGHYYPNIEVDINPTISMDDAKNIVSENESSSESVSDGLYIYIDDESEARLCWKIRTFSNSYLVDAETGNILTSISTIDYGAVTGQGTTLSNRKGISENVSFPVYVRESNYYLVDKIRNIWILDANHTNAIPKSTAIDFNNQYIVKESTNNKWNNHKEAITVYSHVIKVFDYYANVLGRNGASGEHEPIQIAVNYREDNNITWSDSSSACAYSAGTLIEIGDGDDYAKALDAVGHEFTHSVNHNIWDPTYEDTEAKALNEAYADIMGELIEDGVLDLYGQDLANGAIRNFADPSNPEDSSQPSQPSNYRNLYNGILWDKAHVNSGIINHAAYLMDQNWPTSDHADELATLFYRSMYYLSSNSNFLDCRNALLAASKSMNMSYEKRKVIADALTNVGVVHEDEEAWASIHHIKGVVKDASTDKPIIDAKIIAVATSGIGGGIGYSNSTGNYDVKVNRAVYTVSIFADGYKSYRIENVDLSSWTNLTTYMDTVRLVPVSWTSNNYAFASGIITNARTGAVLEGVTVKFRNGSNNQSGSYVQIVSGIDLELQTDSAGKYYTAALPAGNYTLEASRDGYITGYANIVSGNSETCNNQNVSITSELAEGTIRIVLTWGENPRDLDSHVVGTLSNGSRFHVFYADKSKYDGSIEVCNLDIDDVTSYGPETITLNATTEYPYYYYIHRYAGTGSVATSSAKIRVFKGNKLLRTFYVPTDQGSSDYWNVFAIVDGEIIEKNTITSSPNTSYATSSRMRSIYNEDDLDIEDLPEKEPYIEEEEVTEITETEMDGEITIPETEEQSEENSEVSNDISEENSEVTNDDSEDKEVVPENPDESTEENEFAEENQTAEEIVDEENVN